jgi:hypothetical protein
MRAMTGLFLVIITFSGVPTFALDNPSFESRDSIGPWLPLSDARGNRTQARIVQDVQHEGRQSLLLTSQEANEVAVGQVIARPVGSQWRARCWIKTKGLEELPGQDATATLRVRTVDDKVVAEAPGIAGTCDWTEVEVVFRVPPDGSVLLTLTTANPGKAAGFAWFDDLHLDRLEDAKFEQKVLNFPILWAQGRPYNKLLPKNASGEAGPWICGQVAAASIARYWSLKTKMRCSGTYWYYRGDNKERIEADYSIPFQWARMAPDLSRLPETDPRVDPVAEFVYRFCVAQRSQWRVQAGAPYYHTRDAKETLIKHFGFDSSSVRDIHFGTFLQSHSWNDLYGVLRKEIDEGRPVLICLRSTKTRGHVAVITGYRKIQDRCEFTIQWGWRGQYNPAQSFRLDAPIGRYDKFLDHWVSVGLRPDTVHEDLPLYNKVAEHWDSDYPTPLAHMALAWNQDRSEYATVLSVGPAKAQGLCYQRMSMAGLPAGKPFALGLKGNCHKPTIAWSGTAYGLAWEDPADKIATIWFARISPEDGHVLDSQPVQVGVTSDDPWRPNVSLVHNGNEFAIVWPEKGQLQFLRLSSAGVPIPGSRRTIAAGFDPHLVWLADSYVLAFATELRTVQLGRLDRDGRPQGQFQAISRQPSLGAFTPRVVWNGSQFGIAWEHFDMARRHHISFARADAECRPIEGSPVMISDFDGPARTVLAPAISTHKGEFIVTYQRDQAWLTRIDSSGHVIENRYLFQFPAFVTHVTCGDVASVLCLRGELGERSVEMESCLLPLEKQ